MCDEKVEPPVQSTTASQSTDDKGWNDPFKAGEGSTEEQIYARVNKLGKRPDCKDDSFEHEIEFLLSQYDENAEQARHSDGERALISTFLVGAEAAVVAWGFDKEHAVHFWSVWLIVTFLAIFGFMMCEIQYSRMRRHTLRLCAFRTRLEKILPQAKIDKIREIAEKAWDFETTNDIGLAPIHGYDRDRLRNLWQALHGSTIVLSIVLAVVSYGWTTCGQDGKNPTQKEAINNTGQPAAPPLRLPAN
jgi:hypothetical protein